MNNLKRTLVTTVLNLAIAGLPDAQAADTEALERRIRELEARLEKIDQASTQANKAVTATPEVEKLTRKVNTLERKLEVQDEVTATNFSRLPVFDVGENGFRITSQDKKHQLRIRGAVQTDARFFSEDTTHRSTDSFDLKQARVWVEGYVFKDLYYKIMPDFAASGNILPDAYVDYAYHPAISLLAGKFKPSLSLERLQGDSDTVFLERAFPTYLASNRDVGIQLHGAFAKPGYKTEVVPGPIDSRNFLTYQVGVGNGSGDDGSPNNNGGASYDSKEFVGRLFAYPFQHTNTVFDGLGIGIAGTLDDPNKQALKSQATPIGRTTYLNYANTLSGSTGTQFATPTSDGNRSRIYPQAYWYYGPFGVMGEYVLSSQHLSGRSRDGSANGRAVNVKQDNKAWQVQASYILTGEDNSFGAIKPIQNFSPLDGRWGALQLAARWSELTVDNDTFLLLDPTQSARRATAWTVGLNWFLNSYALIRADYEQVSFTGGAGTVSGPLTNRTFNIADRPTEHVFATRFQLAF